MALSSGHAGNQQDAGIASVFFRPRLLRYGDIPIYKLQAVRLRVQFRSLCVFEKRHVRMPLERVDRPPIAQTCDLKRRHSPARRTARRYRNVIILPARAIRLVL